METKNNEKWTVKQQEAYDMLAIELTLISPIEEVVKRLKENFYVGEQPVKVLNEMLHKYKALALEMLGKKGLIKMIDQSKKIEGEMDEKNTKKFLYYFENLLKFFKEKTR